MFGLFTCRHPDKNDSPEAENGQKFQRISTAYQFLIKPPKARRKIIINMGGRDVCVGTVRLLLIFLHRKQARGSL